MPMLRSAVVGLLAVVLAPVPGWGQRHVTTPEAFFDHEIGADYQLPNYRELVAYWQVLARESDRMALAPIGQTTEGRTQFMAVITSPTNHRNLEYYREISRRLALTEGVGESESERLAREGRAVVWIDGGLHASEVLGPQQLIETVFRLVSGEDDETLRILDDVIVLAVHANPDGHDLLSDWYRREPEPTARSIQGLPRLYQKYVGHDNNREFFTATQKETRNMARALYHDWIPQIVYNHHQTGPAGQVMWAPPFRDPYSYNVHPLVRMGVELAGVAMHNRFIVERKPGVGTREAAGYSTWFNGGLRTMAYFHNQVGLLTETKGNPTPALEEGRSDIPFIPAYQLPRAQMPYPVDPQRLSFRTAVDYSVTANYAVLDLASRYREHLLRNIYLMGRDAVEAGQRDSWTPSPRRVEAATQAMLRDGVGHGRRLANSCLRVRTGMPYELQRPCVSVEEAEPYFALLRNPGDRDPRGYVIPSNQRDFPTATKFVNALQWGGIVVHRATEPFTVNGSPYPSNSFVIRTAQPFRPHLLDMFEPQDHPDEFEYEGGPPIHPYDAAGWTLAYQMGVEFDRILDDFDGPFERIDGFARVPPGRVASDRGAGYLLSPTANDAFLAANRLLAADAEVYRLSEAIQQSGRHYPAGTFFLPAEARTAAMVEALAGELGLDFDAASRPPPGEHFRLLPPRIALVDRYGGSRRSGWTRWILEQFEIPFSVVFVQELDRGKLSDRFDAIILVDGILTGTVPGQGDWGQSPFYGASPGPDSASIPAEFHHMLGAVSAQRTVPRLREFLEEGGTVVTIGSSTILALHLGLPLRDKIVGTGPDGDVRALPGEEYFIPASVLEVRVDTSRPVAAGMGERAHVMFNRSPVFAFEPDAAAEGLRAIAWYDSAEPLRSGWAWGQHHLEGGLAAVEAPVGRGTLFLFGPQILFRSQPHGTYKLLFNALYRGRRVRFE